MCGCGEELRDCIFWSAVTDLAEIDIRKMTPADPDYIDSVVRLLAAARSISGADVIIDSSKIPAYLERLGSHPEIAPMLLHIIRDPRGAVVSAHRGWKQKRDPVDPPPLLKIMRVTVYWKRTNRACQRLLSKSPGPTATIAYEDLVSGVDRQTRRLAALAGIEVAGPVTGIGQQHVPAGNPLRYSRGDISIALDDAWHRVLSKPRQALVFIVGLPLTERFGYRPG
jgi:hypothetical protein